MICNTFVKIYFYVITLCYHPDCRRRRRPLSYQSIRAYGRQDKNNLELGCCNIPDTVFIESLRSLGILIRRKGLE